MQLDTVTEAAEPAGSGPSRRSLLTRWAARFRLALSRTRPYILAAGALYVGAFLVTFILREGVILPEDRWLLRQPIVQQPLDLDVGFAEWVYVFRHNVVAGLLGIAMAGLPKTLINAYALGESAASAHAADKASFFWSLILPHGLFEIATSCVASGVGLRFGRSLLTRIRHRADPRGGVRAALADGFVLMVGLVVPATAVAALIEVELSTMWMPLPLAALFGLFAGATFVALIVGIRGPEPGTIAAEPRGTVDDQDAAPPEEEASGRAISEEELPTARAVLSDIAAGGPLLGLVWRLAPRSARAACVRVARGGQRAPDPITACVAAGIARRNLSKEYQALWIAYAGSLPLLIALAGGGWIAVIALGTLGAVLSLRTRGRVKRTERVNRELVDQALRGEIAISMPPSGGFEAAFQEAVDLKTTLRGAPRPAVPPVSHQGYPLGIRLYGTLLAGGIVLVAVAIGVVWMFMATNRPPAFVVGAVGALSGAVGASVVAGASLFHQSRPSPRPPVGETRVWRPTLAVGAGAVVAAVGFGTAGVAVGMFGLRPGLFSAGIGPFLVWFAATFGSLFMWFVAWRIPMARLEANRWGIRCMTPLTTVRIPWSNLRSLEVRGAAQRVVAVTEEGRERTLRVWDPRVPITCDVAWALVAELEAVRQSAMTSRAEGID